MKYYPESEYSFVFRCSFVQVVKKVGVQMHLNSSSVQRQSKIAKSNLVPRREVPRSTVWAVLPRYIIVEILYPVGAA